MSGRTLTPAERRAGELVASQLGGRAVHRDGERDAHDFDVELPDGRTVALEVTAAVDSALASMAGVAFRDQGCFPSLEANCGCCSRRIPTYR